MCWMPRTIKCNKNNETQLVQILWKKHFMQFDQQNFNNPKHNVMEHGWKHLINLKDQNRLSTQLKKSLEQHVEHLSVHFAFSPFSDWEGCMIFSI